MPTDDRDKQFERALARHLSNASHAAACPDAEILAAYHERTLSLEEAAHWNQHIAACSRCQEIHSLLEETDSVPANEWEEKNVAVFAEGLPSVKTVRSFSRGVRAPQDSTLPAIAAATPPPAKVPVQRKSWYWIAPLGALAAGLLIWVGLHETESVPKQATIEVAQNRQQTPPSSAPLSTTPAQLERSEPSSPSSTPKFASKSEVARPKAKPVAPAMGQLAGRAITPPDLAYRSLQADKVKPSEEKGPQEFNAAKTARTPTSPEVSADAFAVRQMPSAPPPSPTATAALGGAGARSRPESADKKDLRQSGTETVEVSGAVSKLNSTSTEAEVSARTRSLLAKTVANERGLIIVAGKKRAWRVGAAGRIELTTDGGKTWESQQSPVATDLTTGSATSDKVCWIVGKAGTVLLSTDGGKHWTPLNSPIQDDLGGVRAVDATHASIWDLANRRSFETSDGGATWTQTVNK